jgi:hypothetical protein
VIFPLVGVVMVAVPLIVDALAPLANKTTRLPIAIMATAAKRSLVRMGPVRGIA